MNLKLYQVDAFAEKLFGGNPAAVVPLDEWIPGELMQQIAMENNLSETAFISRQSKGWEIKWFTPVLEIDLCGHATLASAYVIFNILQHESDEIVFHSKSGPLKAQRSGDIITLDFPSWKPERIEDFPPELIKAIGNPEILGVYKKRDFLIELNDEEAVKNLQPDITLLKQLREKLVVTAPGKEVDFVSRFFAPAAGVDEDPVTGSAHAQLIPFWSEKLGKTKLRARQLSARGGELYCEHRGDRVIMGGKCVFYMEGMITV